MATSATDLPRKHKLTVTDYYRLAQAGSLGDGDRVELIDGEIIDMAPIGSKHAGIVDQLSRILQRAVGDLALVRTQGPVHLGDYSEPEPDIALLRPRQDFYKPGHPTPADVFLIIEVADTSLAYDRDTKLGLYARHGIPEVWLIDVAGQQLAIYRQPTAAAYREIVDPAPLTGTSPLTLPDIHIDLAGLF